MTKSKKIYWAVINDKGKIRRSNSFELEIYDKKYLADRSTCFGDKIQRVEIKLIK